MFELDDAMSGAVVAGVFAMVERNGDCGEGVVGLRIGVFQHLGRAESIHQQCVAATHSRLQCVEDLGTNIQHMRPDRQGIQH